MTYYKGITPPDTQLTPTRREERRWSESKRQYGTGRPAADTVPMTKPVPR